MNKEEEEEEVDEEEEEANIEHLGKTPHKLKIKKT